MDGRGWAHGAMRMSVGCVLRIDSEDWRDTCLSLLKMSMGGAGVPLSTGTSHGKEMIGAVSTS